MLEHMFRVRLMATDGHLPSFCLRHINIGKLASNMRNTVHTYTVYIVTYSPFISVWSMYSVSYFL